MHESILLPFLSVYVYKKDSDQYQGALFIFSRYV